VQCRFVGCTFAKADGRQRPLGLPALEDKIVQSMVSQIPTAIWEEEFPGFSFGFGPGLGSYQALAALPGDRHPGKASELVLDADIGGSMPPCPTNGWSVY